MAGYLFLYLLTVLTLSSTVQGRNEAHCNTRSLKSYETGINRICRLPRGGKSGNMNVLQFMKLKVVSHSIHRY